MSYISKTASIILGNPIIFVLISDLACGLIVLGVLNLLNIFTLISFLDYILSVYYMYVHVISFLHELKFRIFGLILLATIWKMRPILKYFGFIYTFFGKALFDFFLATLVWTDAGTFNYILAICFAILGIINIILTCTNVCLYFLIILCRNHNLSNFRRN